MYMYICTSELSIIQLILYVFIHNKYKLESSNSCYEEKEWNFDIAEFEYNNLGQTNYMLLLNEKSEQKIIKPSYIFLPVYFIDTRCVSIIEAPR